MSKIALLSLSTRSLVVGECRDSIPTKRTIVRRIVSGVMDKALVFLYPLVLFYRFGGNGRGGFTRGGVVLLNVSSGSGDGSPSFATTDSYCDAT